MDLHRINHYPVDSVVCFVNTYSLGSDLSGGWCYPPFDQLGPGLYKIIGLSLLTHFWLFFVVLQVKFYKNGVCQVSLNTIDAFAVFSPPFLKGVKRVKLLFIFQGVAWQDIYDGTYYPAVSLYKNATVQLKYL